jgi:hypothetical protein
MNLTVCEQRAGAARNDADDGQKEISFVRPTSNTLLYSINNVSLIVV